MCTRKKDGDYRSASETDNDLTLPDTETIQQLRDQVTELQKRIKNQDEQLQKADELNQEMLELKPQHWLATEELRITRSRSNHLEAEVQQLRQENQELQKQSGNHEQPDYEAVRARTLNKLKTGRQSTAGKAIDAFIKELKRQ